MGYIREATATGEPAFAQQESIRRWVNENGHRLIALCQDVRTPGHAVGREGLQAIMGIISAGQVDGVVVQSLNTFADDKVTQEVIMAALRANEIKLLSTKPSDLDELKDQPADGLRSLIRHVLDKQRRFEEILRLPHRQIEVEEITELDDATNVVIELVAGDKPSQIPIGHI